MYSSRLFCLRFEFNSNSMAVVSTALQFLKIDAFETFEISQKERKDAL
jgi:hypothetical protein